MSEMVGRVAKIIAANSDACMMSGIVPCDDRPNRCHCERTARAAIEAMREPTGEMKNAGAASYGVGDAYIGEGAALLNGQPTRAWQAMIDEALR